MESSAVLWIPFKKLYIHIQADTTISHNQLLKKLDDEHDALLLGLAFFKPPNERTDKIVAEGATIPSGSRKLAISQQYRKATAELSQLLVGLGTGATVLHMNLSSQLHDFEELNASHQTHMIVATGP